MTTYHTNVEILPRDFRWPREATKEAQVSATVHLKDTVDNDVCTHLISRILDPLSPRLPSEQLTISQEQITDASVVFGTRHAKSTTASKITIWNATKGHSTADFEGNTRTHVLKLACDDSRGYLSVYVASSTALFFCEQVQGQRQVKRHNVEDYTIEYELNLEILNGQ